MGLGLGLGLANPNPNPNPNQLVARCTRPRSPPLSMSIVFSCVGPLRLNVETYARTLTSRSPMRIVSAPCEISWYTVLRGSRPSLAWLT